MLFLDYWTARTASMLNQQTSELRQHIEALLRDYPDLANDEFLRADMLEGETDIKEVLTQIHRMISDTMVLRDGTQPRLDDLVTRRQRFQARIDFGRDLISAILMSADLRKVELPEVTLSLRNNPRQLVGEPDTAVLPDELVRVVRSPDKKKIKEWLEAGREVPGCALDNAAPSLMVKTK
jgi:hypothetical protein